MQTKLSSKGQVVLPGSIRRKLGLRAGESLAATVDDGRIILSRQHTPFRRVRILRDPLTGLPVLAAGAGAPKLSSTQVHELLAEFP